MPASPSSTHMHPDLSLHTVLLRAGVHALGRLRPGLDDEARLVEKLEQRPDKLTNKSKNQASGLVMFFTHVCDGVKDKYSHLHRPMPLGAHHQIMREHGRKWQALSAEDQAFWNAHIEPCHAEKTQARAEARGDAMPALQIARNRAHDRADMEAKAPLTIRSCRLGPAALGRLQTFYDVLDSNGAELRSRREETKRVPEPLEYRRGMGAAPHAHQGNTCGSTPLPARVVVPSMQPQNALAECRPHLAVANRRGEVCEVAVLHTVAN